MARDRCVLRRAAPDAEHADPAWWLLSGDQFRGRLIGRVDVAVTGPDSPVPPGLPRLPRAGEFYASPAMSRLLGETPVRELGARFPGRRVGPIGAAALPSPESLIIVVGHRPDELSGNPRATLARSISTTSPSSCKLGCYTIGIDDSGIKLVLAIAGAALLFPVLIFIGAASRLSAARREQRFAAMRLVGATPQQISIISTVESALAAVAGVALGFLLFYALRPALAQLPFTGAPFYPSDLALGPVDIAAVVLGVPAAAALAARVAMRRVTISPLGVSRRTTPPPPRGWRLIPLAAGLAELAWFVHAGRPANTDGQIYAYLTGILVTMTVLVLAGPWFTMVAARLLSRRTGRAAILIAGRRLGDNPRAGFRAVSGLVLALFVTSVSIGIMTTIHEYEKVPTGGIAARDTLVDRLTVRVEGGAVSAGPNATAPDVPAALLADLRALRGVRGATVVRSDPAEGAIPNPYFGIVSCAELARTPALGRCPAGATAARIAVALDTRGLNGRKAVEPVAVRDVAALPVKSLLVDAQGSRSAVESARTLLEQAFGYRYFPATIAEENEQNPGVQQVKQYQRLADVVMLASLAIAGCSLAVSVAGGLTERKRPFSLLRLSGAPLGVLRRVVALESAVPLIGISVVSIGVGFLSAGLFVRSQLDETLQPPGAGYYVSVVAGLAAALAIVASTLPLLERITGPETARNE